MYVRMKMYFEIAQICKYAIIVDDENHRAGHGGFSWLRFDSYLLFEEQEISG